MTLSTPKLKRGVVRDDGLVFWQYDRQGTKERWYTPEKFERAVGIERVKNKRLVTEARVKLREKLAQITRRTFGEVCPATGKIFWGYLPQCKNGEYWMDPDKFLAAKSKQKEWEKEKAPPSRKLRYLIPEHREAARARSRKTAKTPQGRKRNANKTRMRRNNDPSFALAATCRTRLYTFLKSRGIKKHKKTQEFVGCTWSELKAHIEARFLPGMTWEDRGLWHLDHIVPLASAKTDEDLMRLCHYTNLQPLWAADNLRKSDKLPKP